MTRALLELSRAQVLGFRRRTGLLDKRAPHGPRTLRHAAWAGLQDSMPRAALLSAHARLRGVDATLLDDPGLVQVWGPRFNVYVVAAEDLPVFTISRLPDDARGRARALTTAARLRAVVGDRTLPFGEAGRSLGVVPNSLRYATATGTVLLHWDGARQPRIRMAPEPTLAPMQARLELARRHLHVVGPATAESFGRWAGIGPAEAASAFQRLAAELIPVRSPLGEAWLLATDEAAIRAPTAPTTGVRLLPSGDAYTLCWGADRTLLVPEADRRAALWTTRVWPGALLLEGEVTGVWRRAAAALTIEPWRSLTAGERQAVEAEARSLPLPGLARPLSVRWAGAA